jgi:hypothetical protein
MEKDIDGVLKIARNVKVKLEQMDRNVWTLSLTMSSACDSLHPMLARAHYSPLRFAESREQTEAGVWEGHQRRPIKDVHDHVRSSCIYYANAKVIQQNVNFDCSALKKKLKERMNDFQVQMTLLSPPSLSKKIKDLESHCSPFIAESKTNYTRGVPRSCREEDLHRYVKLFFIRHFSLSYPVG